MMRRHIQLCVFSVAAVGLWCCQNRQTQPPKIDEAQALPPAAPVATAPAESSVAYVTTVLVVRREPTDTRTVPSEHKGKKGMQSNVVAQLQRGEQLEVKTAEGAWLAVRTSDGQDGWVRREGVLLGGAIQPATVHEAQHLFRRPDLLALAGNSMLDPGALIFVLRQKDQFCQINTHAQQTAWVLCAQLDRTSDEVDAAKLLSRARVLTAQQDPRAQELEALAKTHWGHTRLVKKIFKLSDPAVPEATDPNGPPPPEGPHDDASGDTHPVAEPVHEAADPGVASPRGFDAPDSGPPDSSLPLESDRP